VPEQLHVPLVESTNAHGMAASPTERPLTRPP